MILNIGSRTDDWRAKRLSNFSADPFILDGIKLASVEGFIQGIKFPEGNPRRDKAFSLAGREAKFIGKEAKTNFVWWQDKSISYGSPEHHDLIERTIRTKFNQNPEAMKALLATKGLTLTHDLGPPENPHTSLPAKVFCDILTRIREEHLQNKPTSSI